MAISPPPGVYVPVPTFFVSRKASNYSREAAPLDLETQTKHAIHLAKCGIRGLVVLGSTGEAIAITNKERSELLRHVRQQLESAGYKDYPIIAGTATQGIEDTVQQLKDAKDAGAQWGLVLAPSYFATAVTQDGLNDWYVAIADRSPLPIMVYHYPAVCNNITIRASTFQSLASHPNIVGCKLSHGDLSLHTQIASNPKIDSNKFPVFTGLGQQLLAVLTVGGAGAIDGLAAIFPRVIVRLWESTTQGNLDEARSIQEAVCKGEELVVGCGVPGIKEAVSRVLGMGDRDGTRLPLKGGIGDAEWVKWTEIMDDLGSLEQELAS